MRLRNLRMLLRREEGISLIMAIGILGVLSVSGTTLVHYSTANSRTAEYSQGNASAYDLAEAGINEMMAILSNPSNNALNPDLLPATTQTYADGTVEWSGVLNASTAVWSITSKGRVANATGPTANDVERVISAKVPVTPTLTQPLNNPSWNYIMSTQITGGECDMTLDNTVEVGSRLYVFGNLCLRNTAWISGGPLVVQGKVTMFQSQNTIGTAAAPINEAHIQNGCKWVANALHDPCRIGAGSAGHDNLFAGLVSDAPVTLAAPAADFNTWYLNANPGPYYPCTSQSGAPPVFDNDQGTVPDTSKRNRSVSTIFNLVGPSSYSCWTAGGHITWNASTRVLDVSGTIYIDGHIKAESSSTSPIEYNGQATIYSTGSLLIKNTKLCGGILNGACDFDSWDPNTELLVFVADGNNGQTDVPLGVGAEVKSSHLQGGIYATEKVQLDTSSRVDGPLVGKEVVLGQSIKTDDFPYITSVPAGMPGNPTVYAQPNPPELYSG